MLTHGGKKTRCSHNQTMLRIPLHMQNEKNIKSCEGIAYLNHVVTKALYKYCDIMSAVLYVPIDVFQSFIAFNMSMYLGVLRGCACHKCIHVVSCNPAFTTTCTHISLDSLCVYKQHRPVDGFTLELHKTLEFCC